MNNLLTILVFFSVFFSSCSVIKFARYYASADNSSSGKLSGQVYESKDTIYEIGKLSDKWKRINIKGGDLAFWDEAIQATITVNSTIHRHRTSLILGLVNLKTFYRNLGL